MIFVDLSSGKLKDFEINKDMPFSLVISTMRRKRLMSIMMSEERNNDSGKELIATYWKHLNVLRGDKFTKIDRKKKSKGFFDFF